MSSFEDTHPAIAPSIESTPPEEEREKDESSSLLPSPPTKDSSAPIAPPALYPVIAPNVTQQYSFQFLRSALDILEKSAEAREQLLQYNLLHPSFGGGEGEGDEGTGGLVSHLLHNPKNNLSFTTFRFQGVFNPHLLSDYETLLKEFFASHEVRSRLGLLGEIDPLPMQLQYSPLGSTVLDLDFFNRFYDSPILSQDGRIRGCFDETFDGLTVGDLLREFFANEDSENSSLYKESERKELIFHLFQSLVLGGSLCQPDTTIDRYLSLTKSLYKELVTVFKDSKTGEVRISGRAFEIVSVGGLELHPGKKTHPGYSHLYVIVDPLKKNVIVMKNSFHNFW